MYTNISEVYKPKISSEKIAIITARGIAKRLKRKVVFLYKIFNSMKLFLLCNLEIAGAKTLFKFNKRNVVKPVSVNKILLAPTSDEVNLMAIIILNP